jgi:Ca2+-binding RTX toxin-like protein
MKIVRILSALLVVSFVSAPAFAATVKVYAGMIAYIAGPNERNQVWITKGGADYIFTDEGASLQAEFPCFVITSRTVRCAPAGTTGLFAALGDGDDKLWNVTSTGINAQGGSGLDTLVGGSGNDTLLGEGENDQLLGGVGDDILIGGSGEDLLEGGGNNDHLDGGIGSDTLRGGAGDDTLDGGAGDTAGSIDHVQYLDAPCGVTVNLAVAIAQVTRCGGVDTIRNIEGAYGSSWDDRLTGNDAKNYLHGQNGWDTILGGGGNDELYGEEGDDRLLGEAGDDYLYGQGGNDSLFGDTPDTAQIGNDRLEPGIGADYMEGWRGDDQFWLYDDPESEAVHCGDGHDRVYSFLPGNEIYDRCEQVSVLGLP